MIVFPLVAAVISAVFAASLFRQYRQRRKLAQLAWGVALVQYALASLVVAAGVGAGWDPTLFRLYWVFGAMLNVPWLALGSIALVSRRTIASIALALVAVGTVWGFVAVWTSDVNRAELETTQIPKGSDVWCVQDATPPSCEPARGLARTYSLPSFAIVVGIAVASGRKRKGVKPPPERVRANWIIAAGVTLNAIGGFALVGKGRGGPFAVILALSVQTMFAGFVMASRPPKARPEPVSRPDEPAERPHVVLHTTPGCHLCEEARAFLDQLAVPFDEVDASEDPDRFLRVPVVQVGDNEIAQAPIDRWELARALRRAGV